MTGKDLFTRVAERLGDYQQQMIELQRELVLRNAVGPDHGGPGEGEKAAFLADLLRG